MLPQLSHIYIYIYIYIYILSSTPELIPPEMLAVGCRMRAFYVAGGEELLAVS
jgi:hypothetical protein